MSSAIIILFSILCLSFLIHSRVRGYNSEENHRFVLSLPVPRSLQNACTVFPMTLRGIFS